MKMKHWMRAVMLCVVGAMLLTGCASSAKPEGTAAAGGSADNDSAAAPQTQVTIYAAKSMTDSLNEIIAAYETANDGVKILANYASSGDLQSQIENGAPCDLFLSAAQKQMDALCDEDLMDNDSRSDLLTNEAVLITPTDNDTVKSFDDLTSDVVKTVAIGDPQSVPAGQYAQEILTNLGTWDAVSAKAVLGSDVRQVLAWVETGEADAGIVYATDTAVSDGVETVCSAPADSCAPVVYPIALTKEGAQNAAAKAFLEYLKTETPAKVFTEYGFGIAG